MVSADPDELTGRQLTMKRGGYDVTSAYSARDVAALAATGDFDVVVLDADVCDVDPCAFCEEVRSASDVPLIVVSDRHCSAAAIGCLESGADKFLVKSQPGAEFLSRVRSLLRRTASGNGIVRTGDVEVDVVNLMVRKAGAEVELSRIEMALAVELAKRAPGVVLRDDLVRSVWGRVSYRDRTLLPQSVRRLRMKIEDDVRSPSVVRSVRGLGYRFGGD